MYTSGYVIDIHVHTITQGTEGKLYRHSGTLP